MSEKRTLGRTTEWYCMIWSCRIQVLGSIVVVRSREVCEHTKRCAEQIVLASHALINPAAGIIQTPIFLQVENLIYVRFARISALDIYLVVGINKPLRWYVFYHVLIYKTLFLTILFVFPPCSNTVDQDKVRYMCAPVPRVADHIPPPRRYNSQIWVVLGVHSARYKQYKISFTWKSLVSGGVAPEIIT